MKYIAKNSNRIAFIAFLIMCGLFSCIKKEYITAAGSVVSDPPVITGFTPDVSYDNHIVEISGNNFNKVAAGNTVTIGTAQMEVLEASATKLKVRLVPGTKRGYIHVKTNGWEVISEHELVINQLVWQKTLGGSLEDIAVAFMPAGSGYFVAGYTASKDGDITTPNIGGDDMWFAKLDSTKHIVWQKSLGGSFNDYVVAAAPVADGGFLITGWSYSTDGDFKGGLGGMDIWVIKVDGNGNILWKKPFGGTNNEQPAAIIAAADGSCLVAGFTYSTDGNVKGAHGSQDMWVIKLDAGGNLIWQKALGSSGNDAATCMAPDADGGYLVAGNTNGKDGDVSKVWGDYDIWVVKLNSSGVLVWQKTLGGTGYEQPYGITASRDGGCAVVGVTLSANGDVTNTHGDYDAWVVKLNATGNMSWQKTIGGSKSDAAVAIAATADDGYVIAGNTTSTDGDISGNHGNQDIWITKLNADRTLTGLRTLGGSLLENVVSMSIAPDNGYLLAGLTLGSTDGDVTDPHQSGVWGDMWLLKLWE